MSCAVCPTFPWRPTPGVEPKYVTRLANFSLSLVQ